MPKRRRTPVRLLTPGQVIESSLSTGGRAVIRSIIDPVPGVRRLLLDDEETGERLGSMTFTVTGTVVVG